MDIKDLDAMLIHAYDSITNPRAIIFQHPTEFASRMHLTENEVSMVLQRLMQHGLLRIGQSEDQKGVLHETFSLQPLWDRLVDHIAFADE